jgi:two-component system, OmpR family, sensor histidine kinase RstB
MRKQFLRFYVGIFLVLLLAAGALMIAVEREFEKGIDQQIERSLSPLIKMIGRQIGNLSGSEDLGPFLMYAIEGKADPISVKLSREDALPIDRTQREQLAARELLVVRQGETRTVYARVPTGEILEIGPIAGSGTGRRIILIMFLPLILFFGIGTAIYLLLRPIERRIYDLSETAQDFGRGNLDRRAKVGKTGSIDELEADFNQMAGRIQHLIADQKDLLRAVSHDLRTPLSRIFFALENAQEAQSVEEKNEQLGRIDKLLVEMNELIGELRSYLQLDQGTAAELRAPVPIAPLFTETIHLAAELRPELQVLIDCGDETVYADPRHLKRALRNLAANAIRHAKGTIRLSCRYDAATTVIVVEDDGGGVPEAESKKVFEPFYRLDDSRSSDSGGSGLGLAIVERIAVRHDGAVSVSMSDLGGARFELGFPTKN